MTIQDFQKRHGPDWAILLKTDMGVHLMEALRDCRPKPICEGVEHQTVYRLGAIAGYEQAQENLKIFASPLKAPINGPEQNYGVHKKVEDKT